MEFLFVFFLLGIVNVRFKKKWTLSKSNYFIKSRSEAPHDLFFATLNTPPYTSDFVEGSDGLGWDIYDAAYKSYHPRNSTTPSSSVKIDAVEAGDAEEKTGLFHIASQDNIGWVIGPITREEIYRSGWLRKCAHMVWLEEEIRFIVDSQSELAHLKYVNFDNLNARFIMVENSSEHKLLTKTDHYIPPAYLSIANLIKKPSNPPILVSNVCEGMRLLEDYNTEQILEMYPVNSKLPIDYERWRSNGKVHVLLLTTELIASHFASGNPRLSVWNPFDPNLEPLMKYSAINCNEDQPNVGTEFESRRAVIAKVWKKYDKDACHKLASTVYNSGGSLPIVCLSLLSSLLLSFIVVI